MHMADALLSPAVGLALWAVSAGSLAYCSRRVSEQFDERKVPLMGVLGAFLFAAQMINFSIPGTGSSGHLGGGLLLAILLGPHAALLTLASVLLVQALFFADGGLLALGCNIFNLGFLPAFVAYPLVYRKLLGERTGASRRSLATIVAAVVGLQLGALGVVVETVLSGRSALTFATFALFMQPIHLLIGIAEGLLTAALATFIARARPEMLHAAGGATAGRCPQRKLLGALLAAAMLTGGLLSWFASTRPDGLEWSIAKAGSEAAPNVHADDIHRALSALQEKSALLPDYAFRPAAAAAVDRRAASTAEAGAKLPGQPGRSVAGIAGGLSALALALLIGALLKRRGRRQH